MTDLDRSNLELHVDEEPWPVYPEERPGMTLVYALAAVLVVGVFVVALMVKAR